MSQRILTSVNIFYWKYMVVFTFQSLQIKNMGVCYQLGLDFFQLPEAQFMAYISIKYHILLIIIMLNTKRPDLLLQTTSNKSSDIHTSESSEPSEKSITYYIETHFKSERVITRRQIQQMNQRVKNELMRNRKTYDKLVSLNPYFSMKLYSPHNVFNSQQYNQTSINLMLKQLDLLLEDGHLLEKEIKKTQLRKMQSDYMNNYEVDNSKHHYAYIRKIWLGSNEADSKNPLERIQQLNKKVVLVKNNLYSLTDVQKKSYERIHSNDDYANVVSKINEVVQQTKEYTLLKEKYQDLKMSYQDLQQKFHSLTVNLSQVEEQKNEIIKKLRQENDQCKKMLKESKEKQLAVEIKQAQLLLKIKELEHSVRQKKNDKNEARPSITSLKSDSSRTKLIINMDDIKFRKIQAKEIVIANNQKQRENNKEQISQKNFDQLQINETQPSISRFSPTKEISENYNQMNDRTFHLADQKSPDNRKGRFIRMRSPGGGKLIKNKPNENMLSPRYRESEGKNLICSEK